MATVVINTQEELEQFKEYTHYEIWRGDGLSYEKYEEAHTSLMDEFKDKLSLSFNRLDETKMEAYNTINNAVFMSDTVSRFMLIDSLSILTTKSKAEIEKEYKNFLDFQDVKHYYNCYAKTEIPVYTNFFSEEFISNEGAFRISTQDPSENKLIINCNIKLQDGSILDVYGNLEAKNIVCGFLGVSGSLNANDIECEKLYAEEVEANSIKCYKNDITFSWSNALTINADVYSALNNTFDVEFLQPSHQFGKMNDIIIGKYEYQPADNLDNPRFTGVVLINDSPETVSYYLDKHNIFNAGKLKVNSIKTNNIVCGEAEIKNLTCNTILNSSTLYDELKTINYYRNSDYAKYNYEELSKEEQEQYNTKLICKVPPKTRLDFSNLKCETMVSDNSFSNHLKCGYCLSNERLCCSGNISSEHIKSNILLGSKIEADYLQSARLYSQSVEANVLKIEESINSDYTSVNYRFDYKEGALLESNFSINPNISKADDNLNQLSKAKPKPISSNKDITPNKFFKI